MTPIDAYERYKEVVPKPVRFVLSILASPLWLPVLLVVGLIAGTILSFIALYEEFK